MFTKQLELWGLSLIEIGMGINMWNQVENMIYIRLPRKKLVAELKKIDKNRYLGNTKSNGDEKMTQRKSSQR